MDNIEQTRLEIYEKALFDISLVFQSEIINRYKEKLPFPNYHFRRIGNYSFISRISEYQDDLVVNFRIDDRHNENNLFNWNYIYDFSEENKNREIMYKLDDKLSELDFKDYVFFNLKKGKGNYNEVLDFKDKLLKKYLKEFFKGRLFTFRDFKKAINIILKNEYNKVYQFEDLDKNIFFDKDKDLKENDKVSNEDIKDCYYLFYSLDKLDIIGFYSIITKELENNKEYDYILFQKSDFENAKEFLNTGKTLKEWLEKYLEKNKWNKENKEKKYERKWFNNT